MKKRASQKNMTRKTALYTEVSFYAPSRFPGLQHKSAFPSRIKCNGYESSITEYSDRIVQDSHLIPSSENECDCSSCKHSQISCRSFFQTDCLILNSALDTFILLNTVIIFQVPTKVKIFF